jgi:hypothetical protein
MLPRRLGPCRLLALLISSLTLSVAFVRAADRVTIGWTNNMLKVAHPRMPGGSVDIWYLEAFCRSGSTKRDWNQTTIPHRTELLSASPDGRRLELRTKVEPSVEMRHVLTAGEDEVDFQLRVENRGAEFSDVQWFQPCLRVDRFTGRKQSNYIDRCFIFTSRGLTMLDQTRRTEDAIYRGGQVYVPAGIDHADVNPRPISPETPVNPLIGCVSTDGQWLLATAFDQTQELFQGVIVCIHNDPRLGGLRPGEVKELHGKLYFLKNDPAALLKRYEFDFKAKRR